MLVDGCLVMAELMEVWWSEIAVRCQSAYNTTPIILYINYLQYT